ncbi:MAG: hypothetical protein J6O62_03240 [Bacilli bacterium]|nr:hypothetical protein [Bacilli bacterium]MBO6195740.1 hypothetical protein [Bacilli bacterium]
MNLEDQYKLLVESYYGIELIDEYDLKVYMLKQIDKMIIDFKNAYDVDKDNKIKEYVINKVSDKTKLQSSLITLNQINGPMDLILLIRKRLKNLQN